MAVDDRQASSSADRGPIIFCIVYIPLGVGD